MKKLLSLGLLTVCALAISENQAHAWVNCKFSIGLNWHLQSANNSTLWGLWKNGQVPGPEAFGGGGQYGTVPFGQNPGGGAFPFYGSAPQAAPQGYPTETTPPPVQTTQQQAYYGMPQNYSYNPYQAVSYQPNAYSYPSNYYPIYNQYYGYQYQAPSYWYQGR
jgi:hypothetical protein